MAAHVNFDLDDAYDDANAHKDGARPLARLGSGCGEPLCGVIRRGGEVRTIGEAHGAAAALESFKHWLAHTGSPKSKIKEAKFGESSKAPDDLPSPFEIVK